MKDWLTELKSFVYDKVNENAKFKRKVGRMNLTKKDFDESRRECPKGLNDQ